jgi:uncharacterized protein (TIGR02597 family)
VNSVLPLRHGIAALIALLGFSLALEASAQSVATPPVGTVTIPALANSDTIVAVPLENAVEFHGTVSSVQAGGTSEAMINLNGSPAWTSNQFQGFYYLRIRSGAKAGMYYAVSANTSSQLTVYTAGDDLSAVVSGDALTLHKFWTLNTLFPYNDSSRNPLTQSTSNLGPGRRSQIIIPNNNGVGINLPAFGSYYFTSTGWVKSIAGNPPANDTLLFPDEFLVIRQPSAITTDVNLVFVGTVNTSPLAIPVASRSGGAQDNALALMRPIDVRLADSGLEKIFLQSTGHLGPGRRDQLLVFNAAARGINKSAAKAYYRCNNQWYRSIAGSPLADNDVLPAGAGFLIRRYQSANPQVTTWINTVSY